MPIGNEMVHRLKIIIPINNDSLNEITAKELLPLESRDFDLDIHNLSSGPNFIENRYSDYIAHPALIDAATVAEAEGYSGIFVDCFTDPAVDIMRELVDMPVVGAFLPAVLTASLLCQRYSIITVLPEVVPIYEQLSRESGIRGSVVSIRNIGTHVADLDDRENLVENLFTQCLAAVEEGAQGVVLGCTGMLGVTDFLRQRLLDNGLSIPVINPTKCGVAMLMALVRQGLTHSRITYPLSLRQALESQDFFMSFENQ